MEHEDQDYRMSFTLGGLMVNESVEVARLHAVHQGWKETMAQALTQGVTALPKAASRRRSLREVIARLATLSDQELAFLTAEAERSEQQMLLWLANCRAYRFVAEFATDVLQERFLARRFDLPPESFDLFFEEKAEWHRKLATISASTRRKLRQVLFRIMREAGVISDANAIQHANLSPRLEDMIRTRKPTELVFFPGFAHAGRR